jgi:dUTP pyrophosphatase
MTTQGEIHFEALHDGVRPPTRATSQSAGYDLSAWLTGTLPRVNTGALIAERAPLQTDGGPVLELAPGEIALVPLGFRARLPAGYEAQIRPRSGTSFKRGLTIPNAPGTIDADFPDEWMVLVRNSSAQAVRIAHGERIAQAVLQRYEVLEWVSGAVGVTTERSGGFGSTGN